MLTTLEVKGGYFTAEGECIEPAVIILTLSDLQLPEYKSNMAKLAKDYPGCNADATSAVFRKNRTVIVRSSDSVHDGQNPHEGNRCKT